MSKRFPTHFWLGSLLICTLLLTGCGIFSDLFGGNDDDGDNEISEVFVFGDSISDTGNVFLGTDGDIPVSPPYFEGRFSNGPVWVERFAESLGLKAEPVLDNGTNFAVGAARASRDVDFIIDDEEFTVPGILSQVDLFFGSQTDLFDKFKDFFIDRDKADEDALYVIFIGGDDIRDIVLDLDGGFDATTTINTAIANISEAIRELEAEGARWFLVLNVPNPGLSPETVAHGLDAVMLATELTDPFNETSFNFLLQKELDALEGNLNITIFRLDTFALLEEIVTNPESFDLTNVTDPCLEGETPEFDGGTPCANPGDFLFWDLMHATTKVHAILAERALMAVSTLTTR
jgi:phospholipase/lecithinase/hemolysin